MKEKIPIVISFIIVMALKVVDWLAVVVFGVTMEVAVVGSVVVSHSLVDLSISVSWNVMVPVLIVVV